MVIPDKIKKFTSVGERILYLKFKMDESVKEMYILHSVFTNHHLKNVSGEIDFLIIAPNKGVFCIEVKHGRVSRKGGTWFFTDRKGNTTERKLSPFAQVDGTMHSIRNYVLKKVKDDPIMTKRLKKIVWGSGVAFTSIEDTFNFGPEGQSWQVLWRSGLEYPISYYIDSLSKGWHEKYSSQIWYDKYSSRPSKKDCETILKIIRGDFNSSYLEGDKLVANDKLVEEFTKEQFDLLDFTNFNDRCLIEGEAGCGKTFMALELAKRNIELGYKVALFCYNKKLGQHLKNVFSDILSKNYGDFYIGNLHSFMTKMINNNPKVQNEQVERYYSEEVPIEFLIENENITNQEKYDAIILDEAQDLISPYYLEVFDLLLKNGLRNGRWVMFGDFSNQEIFLSSVNEKIELLMEKAYYTRFPTLRINCRNTKIIAKQNTLMTGAILPLFTPKNIDGEHVEIIFCEEKMISTKIEEIIRKLDNKKIELNRIMLLSPKKIINTKLSSSQYIRDMTCKGLGYSTIQSFKGLESSIVILYGFDEINTELSRKLLYVGISRAVHKLYIVLNKKLENDYGELLKNNITKLG